MSDPYTTNTNGQSSGGIPGPAPFQWNTGNGTNGPTPGISGTPPVSTAPAIPAPAPTAPSSPSTSGGASSAPSASDNPGFGGLQFSPPPSGSTSTSTQPSAAPSPAANSAPSAPVHYAGLSSSPIPGAAPGGAIAFDDGGAVPDQSQGDPVTAAVNQALESVSSLFDFGRQKHGLSGGGDNQDAGPTWGQLPNTSGLPDAPQSGPMTAGSKTPGEIMPTPLVDPESDKGYSSPTATGRPPAQTTSAARGGAIPSYADGGGVEETGDEGAPDVSQAAQDQGGGGVGQQAMALPQGVPDQAQSAGQGAQGGPKRAIGYLTGEGAMPSQNIAQLEKMVDPRGQMPPEIRKLLAVHAAKQQGGDEAGWAAMQHYRQRFLMLNGLAAAQMKGNQQKPPNPALAAQTATDAHTNSLMGDKVSFTPSPQGLLAHVQPYKRPTQQPAMAQGGAIPSYADGGGVPDLTSDMTVTPDQPHAQSQQQQ